MTDLIRVFLLDDHELVRRGVGELLSAEPDIEVVGQAGSVEAALAAAEAARPDVALLDVRLPDGSGVEVCRELKSRMPDLGCLMLTSCSARSWPARRATFSRTSEVPRSSTRCGRWRAGARCLIRPPPSNF